MIALRRTCAILALLFGLAALQPAAAEDNTFDFEMILFERPGAAPSGPAAAAAEGPDRALARARLDSLPAVAKALGPVAYTLRQRGMTVHEHQAWRMSPGGISNDTWYWVGDGRLEGLIRVGRGRFLHLDADLLLQPAGAAEPARIRLSRRMRSGELHYVDHPQVGILIQAERYRPEPPAREELPAGEPKPVEPVGTPG